MELSVVIPCLDEVETLGECVRRAREAIAALGVEGEVIVADNGSTDGSVAAATEAGARVVSVPERGYGAALMGGIASARGAFIVMGDGDLSYDFREIPRYFEQYRAGFELVQGCRLPGGGGNVAPGAMPVTHRVVGNPLFSRLARLLFRSPVHDVFCGLRGFTRELYERLDLRCTGMEFAVEMIVKASLAKARTTEVPITLHPDGRTQHAPHLSTLRDGWRTLRFLLLSSPRWLYVVPGIVALGCGALGYAVALPGLELFGARIDVHTLLVASLALLLGHQALVFGLLARTFAVAEGLLPPHPAIEKTVRLLTLERGLVLAIAGALVGLALIAVAFLQWRAVDYGSLDYARTMRWVIPGVTLTALGAQTMFASFLLSLLVTARR